MLGGDGTGTGGKAHRQCSGVRLGGTVLPKQLLGVGVSRASPGGHAHGSPLVSNSGVALRSQVSRHTCATSVLLPWAA